MSYKKREVFETGPYSQYKKHYSIAFYDASGESFYMMFKSIREILQFKGLPPTRQNVNKMDVLLYRALNRISHKTKMLDGTVRTVWLINENEDD